MLEGLRLVHGGVETLPFVRMFYSSPSRYLWEDQEGVVHTIDQGEGGEQGDPLMLLLFSLGQHGALEAVQRSLRDGERMLAYLDDIYIVTSPDCGGCDCELPGTVVPPRTDPFARWQDASAEWGWN